MGFWDRLIPWVFPGSAVEYRGARRIHFSEIRIYRRRLQYIVGVVCFFAPLIYLFLALEGWWLRSLLVLVGIGELSIRDTLCEHYCLVLYRLGYGRIDMAGAKQGKSAERGTGASAFGGENHGDG